MIVHGSWLWQALERFHSGWDRTFGCGGNVHGYNAGRDNGVKSIPAVAESIDMFECSKVIHTPLGRIGVTWKDCVLTGVDLEPKDSEESTEQLPLSVSEQFDAYFREGSARFDLSMKLRGTSFQRRVWAVLRTIPPGRTLTYGELASKLDTGARAIGGACRANPCPIVVPCHRVVAANGLGGFAGDITGRKLEVKRWLLRHEGNSEF